MKQKEIRFGDLGLGLQLMIGISFIVVLICLLFAIVYTFTERDKRIAYLECHNETFEGFVNKSEAQANSFCLGNSDTRIWDCSYDGYEAKCPYDSDLCYVEDTKEVCEVV